MNAFSPSPAPSNVSALLAEARDRMEQAGADSPWLTALVLLEHATGLGREDVLAHPDRILSPPELDQYQDLVDRRCAREPVAYILGYREFYGRRFAVTPATLIPRPETETLVHLALDRFRPLEPEESRGERAGVGSSRYAVLDVGTGCGAIVVSLLVQEPRLAAVGTDSAQDALAVARRNAESHGVLERLRLVGCHLTDAIAGRFPLVVANLPYVPSDQMDALDPEVAHHEPRHAIDGGPDGMSVIRAFLPALSQVLVPGGVALLEIGEGQAAELVERARDLFPEWTVGAERDEAGMDRFLVVERREG
ncbi:MAG: peptide chain release factor N(5)-glutamine methyltransferase [Chloroflexi bacterium]|nr:peptide chain release factor N(5)-glutamine methyltransferase [Chloroflexota bacterium]